MRGNIRKRGANSWLIQLELDRINGKRNRRFVTIKGTYKDAQKELTRLLNAVDAGSLPDVTNMTVAEYVTAYLDGAHSLAPKTLERYRELAAHQIKYLGDVKLQKLRPEHIEQWHATLLKTGLSARTVGHAHRLLGLVLKRAVENGTIAHNVAAIRKPPKVEDEELQISSAEQIAEVLAKLNGHTLHPIVSLALATGMRRGELLGLQWGDIELDTTSPVLRVERSVEETRAGLRLKSPKTKRGRRNITLPPAAVTMLRAHKVKQMEQRLLLGQGTIKPDTLGVCQPRRQVAIAGQSQQGLVQGEESKEAARRNLSRLETHPCQRADRCWREHPHHQSPLRPRQAIGNARHLWSSNDRFRCDGGKGYRRGAEVTSRAANGRQFF
jgi:integrase